MTCILTSRPRRIWLALLAFCGTLSLAAVASHAGTIVDNAHIFSSSAVAQAQQVIDQIRSRHQKDLNVETIAAVPADQQAALEAQGKNAFFEQWARERAKAMGTNGVYVLICMEPRHLQVEVGDRTETREFTAADRDALRTQLVSQFKDQQYDAGLTDAANFVLERMDANTRQSSVPNPGTGFGQSAPIYGGGSGAGGGTHFGGWICMGVAVLFLVLMFLRRGGGSGGYGPNYPMNPGGQMGWGGGGGGGGFGRGLLGGILGGALGSWGYDRFTRGGGLGDSSSFGPDNTGSGSGFSGSSGTDSSFSGSGGDFGSGDSGGGGGGGGGDSGGGGGGDF